MWYIFTMKYYSNFKKNNAICSSADESGDCHTEVSQTDVNHKFVLAICLYKD